MAINERRQFGRYVLLERVAKGGMAEVFRAKTESVGGFAKIVAIKRLHAHYSTDDNFVRMLLDEARIAALLSHAGVAQIYDVGVVDSHYYIAMEYVHGQSVYNLLKAAYARDTNIPIALACHIASEVAIALHHAHSIRSASGESMQIVHRDVSPQNVMISYEGDVKVVDFGIAKAVMRSTETQSGVIKGKFYYMAPEQARGKSVDHRCDIFATGILLYELLTTHPCYDEEDNAILLDKVKSAQYTPPQTYRPELPEKLLEILAKSMAADLEDRYQTAVDFAWDLTRFLKAAHLHPTRLHVRKYMGRMFGIGLDSAHVPVPEPSSKPMRSAEQEAILLPAALARPDTSQPTQIFRTVEEATDPELRPAEVASAKGAGVIDGSTARNPQLFRPTAGPVLLSIVFGASFLMAVANIIVLVVQS
jgi:serine/threonine protein kinase